MNLKFDCKNRKMFDYLKIFIQYILSDLLIICVGQY